MKNIRVKTAMLFAVSVVLVWLVLLVKLSIVTLELSTGPLLIVLLLSSALTFLVVIKAGERNSLALEFKLRTKLEPPPTFSKKDLEDWWDQNHDSYHQQRKELEAEVDDAINATGLGIHGNNDQYSDSERQDVYDSAKRLTNAHRELDQFHSTINDNM